MQSLRHIEDKVRLYKCEHSYTLYFTFNFSHVHFFFCEDGATYCYCFEQLLQVLTIDKEYYVCLWSLLNLLKVDKLTMWSAAHLCLLITGASSPLLSGPLAMLPPILDSPVRLADNNNLHHSPVMPFGTRAMTLPEISGNRNLGYYIRWSLVFMHVT
jgi:hypothetical protein